MKEHILLANAFKYDEPSFIAFPSNCTYQTQRGYWTNDTTGEAMMLSDDPRQLQTKKCDRETGEDQKGE